MSNLFITLTEYFSYSFVKYAFIVSVLTALCSSLLGVVLVLKRYSFIGDGLSHVAFGALAIASVMKLSNQMLVVIPVTAITAVILLCVRQRTKIKGDAALAMVSVGALATGYLLLNIFPVSSNINGDVCGTLFGSSSILTLSEFDVMLCLILSIIVILFFILFYNKIFSVTFDEAFASSQGINVFGYNVIIAVISAVIIVMAMNLAGSLLTSALIVFPAISAMRISKSFKGVIIWAVIISVIGAVLGILSSIIFDAPIGPCITVADIALFFLAFVVGKYIAI